MENKTISIDGYRKIHRAQNVSFNMHLLIRRQEVNAAPLLWIPDIFSYIADDLSDISEELKAQGLYDEWLRQERNNAESK
ncbi:Derepression protein [Salmonella enterica subsp. enterica]|nr:Derepression protein [Salmonella enterica subsp. enterica]